MFGSKPFSFSKEDVLSWMRGAGISAVGAVLAYVSMTVIPELEASALTPQAAITVWIFSNVINGLQRLIRDTR